MTTETQGQKGFYLSIKTDEVNGTEKILSCEV